MDKEKFEKAKETIQDCMNKIAGVKGPSLPIGKNGKEIPIDQSLAKLLKALHIKTK